MIVKCLINITITVAIAITVTVISAIALGATLSSHFIHPVPSGGETPTGERPRLFTPDMLQEVLWVRTENCDVICYFIFVI